MTLKSLRPCLPLLCWLMASSGMAASITLDAQTQQRLGIRTAPLKAMMASQSVQASAQVLDALPLLRLLADLEATEQVARLSRAEAVRLRALHADDANVALRAVEAAESAAAVDAARLEALQAELSAGWGAGVARMGEADRAQLKAGLSHGRSGLLRIEPLQGLAGRPRSAVIENLNGAVRRAVILGSLPSPGTGIQVGWLASVEAPDLAVGLVSAARVELPVPRGGVLVPREAVLRWNGLSWVYLTRDGELFERFLLEGAELHPAGWWVGQGIEPGTMVVVGGAGAMLSAETLVPEEEE